MQFWEKLDFLMKITNTTNSALSMYVKLDASHISRLRRGKRSALKNMSCISLMADCFSRRCIDDYQRRALTDVLGVDLIDFDDSNLKESITRWLMIKEKDETRSVGDFITGLSNITIKNTPNPTDNIPIYEFPKTDTKVYYGIEGKRRAAIHFIMEVLAQSRPQTLLLFSDEPTDWMTADSEFAAKWAALMIQVLSKGNHIKIIHTVSRDLDEMLHAISQWMPLYMSGSIDPYYYPKKRDGIFKRTLFIAPNTSAVLSSSVGDMMSNAAIFLLRNRETIDALKREFNQYLYLCNPLMRIFTPKNKESYIITLLEFEKEKNDCIIETESLSSLTMPESVVNSVYTRMMNFDNNTAGIQKKRMANLIQHLQSGSFTEVVKIYDVETVKRGEVKVACSDMLAGGAVYYTLDEYILHLKNIQNLILNQQNFFVYLTNETVDNRYMVYAKEDMGVIVAKTSAPPVALAINEGNLTAAFWDYLRTTIGEKAYKNKNKKDSYNKLSEYINRLEQI